MQVFWLPSGQVGPVCDRRVLEYAGTLAPSAVADGECELAHVCFAADFPSIHRVQYAGSPQFDLTPAIRTEHICLESEEFDVPARVRGRRIGPSLKVASRFRGCETELAWLDGHRLEVRTQRRRGARLRYEVDLRFIDGEATTRRRIAWRCWQVGAALAALSATSFWLATMPDGPSWIPTTLPVSIGLLVAALGVGVLALYRTHDTVELVSVHGRAVLVAITGNIGCSRATGAFTAEIVRRIDDARAQLRQSKQQFLRDELREHRRLFEDGVLAEADYEAGKRRILRAHG